MRLFSHFEMENRPCAIALLTTWARASSGESCGKGNEAMGASGQGGVMLPTQIVLCLEFIPAILVLGILAHLLRKIVAAEAFRHLY